jgi:sugar (pentulose or hexulose) kinase
MARDFLLMRLTGEFCSDAWSAKGLAHLLTGEAPPEYYETLGVAALLAPRILAPTTVAGTVHGRAAAATGLRIGTPVVTGWSDALSGMAGTGAFGSAGTAFDITGTSEIVGLSGAPATVGLLHVPASLGGVSVVYGPTQSGGDSLVWFAHWIGVTDIGRVSALAATAPPGADGVLFLPISKESVPQSGTRRRGGRSSVFCASTAPSTAREPCWKGWP